MSQRINKKFHVLALGYGATLLLLLLRLVHLQITLHGELAGLGQQNMLRVEKEYAPRGNIVDCQGQLLATSRPTLDVCWQGSGAKQLSAEQQEVIELLCKQPGAPSNLLSSVLSAQRAGHQITMLRTIDFALLAVLQERYGQVPGLLVKTRYERHYPARTLAAHVLGSVGIAQGVAVGRSGLEKRCDAQLQGTSGYATYVANSQGRRIGMNQHELAQPGNDVQLTIDLALQTLAESAFAQGSVGACVVMDANTGAIRALCSMPSYDPNLFTRHLSQHEWTAQFTQQAPLLCRATQALYPPASLYKLVTFAAGIEEGIISSKTNFYCNGAIELGGRLYACNRHGGHGRISASLAIAHSCNIPCYDIGKKIDIDVLGVYAHACGLGKPTGFILDEQAGLVPSSGWKGAVKGEQWWPGETLSSCIGQGYLLVTPLQIARMFGGICTGELVRPRIIATESIEKTPIAFAKKTRQFLVNAMRKATSIGTARSLHSLKNFTIAAKTGTAQVVDAKHRTGNLEHGWFAGVASYRDENPMVIVALVEHAGSSLPAIKVAGHILRGYAELRS